MKKLLALLLSLATALSLAACGGGETAQQEPGGDAAGETYSFSVGTNTAEDSVNHLLAAKFKELIEDRSDGAVTVTLYENGALGGDAELTESCIAGSVDFIVGMAGSLVNYPTCSPTWKPPGKCWTAPFWRSCRPPMKPAD